MTLVTFEGVIALMKWLEIIVDEKGEQLKYGSGM
jgi:hypothetical protein